MINLTLSSRVGPNLSSFLQHPRAREHLKILMVGHGPGEELSLTVLLF